MKTSKPILMMATLLSLACAGWAQGQKDLKDDLRNKAVSDTDSSGKSVNLLTPKSNRPKIRKTRDSIEFLDQKGTIKRRIQLGRKEEWKEVQIENWKGKKGTIHDVKGDVFSNGQYTGLLTCEADSIEGWGVTSSTCIFKYLDAENNVLWEKKGVGNSSPYWSVSSNGKRIFLVEDAPPSPSSGEEYFSHKPAIYDETGKVIWAFDSYDNASGFKLTKNGKYGLFRYAKRNEASKLEEGIIFFNTENKRTHIYKFGGNNKIGSADISESGKATLYTVEDEILDTSVRPFKVKTTRHIFYEYQF